MGRLEHYMPILAMLVLQFTYAGLSLITRVALIHGLSPRVLVFYRHALATIFISPIAYFSRRKSGSCSLSFRSFALLFLSALIGVTFNQNVYYMGLHLASSSMASAMSNLIPGVTFIIALVAGMERVNIGSWRGIAKVGGTLMCVSGAVSMALLRGPKLLNSIIIMELGGGDHDQNWLQGCLFLFLSCCLWSIWLILQGVIGSALSFFIQGWCISRRGPLFSAMFNPLCTVIVTIFAALFLHEEIYTGSLIGAVGVIMGLYIVLWGKAKDVGVEKTTDAALQSEETTLLKDELLFDENDRKIDLEQPLLSTKIIVEPHS